MFSGDWRDDAGAPSVLGVLHRNKQMQPIWMEARRYAVSPAACSLEATPWKSGGLACRHVSSFVPTVDRSGAHFRGSDQPKAQGSRFPGPPQGLCSHAHPILAARRCGWLHFSLLLQPPLQATHKDEGEAGMKQTRLHCFAKVLES